MTSFETPPLYLAIHIILGMISYFYPILIILIIAYQLLQWILGYRFFLFSWQIKQGNSLDYTLYKLMQYAAGYFTVYGYQKLKPKQSIPDKE
jgi:hypothetical protein